MDLTKQFFKYVSQNIFGLLGTSCYILADTYFIAQAAGTDGVTLLNLCLPIYNFIFAIGSMIALGSATRYAIAKAQNDARGRRYFSNAILCAVLASIPWMLAGAFVPGALLRLMGGDAGIVTLGIPYARIFLLFTPFFMCNYIVSAFVRNDGDPSLAMVATLSGSLFNVVFDYIFMFPLGLGLAGAALATAVSPIISIAICSRHFLKKENTLQFVRQLPSVKLLAQSCQLGISGFVGEVSSGVTTTVFNFLLLGLAGNVGVAAYGVVANFALVATAIFNGVAQGAQPLVSRCYGQNDHAGARKLLLLGSGTVLVLAAVLCLCAPAALAADDAAVSGGAVTMGGANTTLIPAEEENCLSWLFGSGDTITLPYLNIRGQGLKKNVTLNLVDCLVGITYNELGSIGSYVSASAAQQAWKAQAVAAHSYLEYHKQYGSSANALVYTPVDQIPSAAREAIRKAVEPVKDEILTYNGSVCDAVWSASAGYNTQTGVYGTCSSRDAWGTEVPYLQSVESPYEEQYHNLLRRSIGKDYTYVEYNDSRTGEPYTDADTTHKSLGGYVQYNTFVSNGRSYRYIGQFVSSRYCFDFGTDENGTPCMTYYGFGHGVGMSQCGAVGYAAERNMGYKAILRHYYKGASITSQGSSGGLFGWLRSLFG